MKGRRRCWFGGKREDQMPSGAVQLSCIRDDLFLAKPDWWVLNSGSSMSDEGT